MIGYMAPLEGITTYIYRNAWHRHFHPMDKYFTPFIVPAARRPLRRRERRDADPANNAGLTVIPQILTADAGDFLEAADALGELGYREINLNLGCPSGTVAAGGRGAGFLRDPDRLDAFLEEVFQRCELAVSLKTRLGWADPSEMEELIPVFNRYPISELILHPRVRQEFYRGEVHRDAFAEALREVNHPLIYNGNLFRAEEIRQVFRDMPDTAGVMLGRGLISQPALWDAACRGEAGGNPACEEAADMPCEDSACEEAADMPCEDSARGEVSGGEGFPDMKTLRAFHDEIVEGYRGILASEESVIHKMKEIWCYMVQGVTHSEVYDEAFHRVHRREDYEELTARIFAEESLNWRGFVPPEGWQIRNRRKRGGFSATDAARD